MFLCSDQAIQLLDLLPAHLFESGVWESNGLVRLKKEENPREKIFYRSSGAEATARIAGAGLRKR